MLSSKLTLVDAVGQIHYPLDRGWGPNQRERYLRVLVRTRLQSVGVPSSRVAMMPLFSIGQVLPVSPNHDCVVYAQRVVYCVSVAELGPLKVYVTIARQPILSCAGCL